MFLDLDNLLIGAAEARLPFDVKLIVDQVEELVGGRAVLRRAYGDYRQQSHIPRQLALAGFQLQSLVRLNQSDKNLADMQMVADAVETLIDGYSFQCYAVITGDRDFMPLVQVLRRHDKHVIGIGVRHTTSGSLVGLCDQYLYYDDLVPQQEDPKSVELEHWLESAAQLAFRSSSRVQASVFRDLVQQASNGAFSRSAQAKGSFSKLLERFPSIIQLERESTTLFVSSAGQAEAEQEQSPQADLYLKYRSALKKRGLRVILPKMRTVILRDLIHLLSHSTTVINWQDVLNRLSKHYEVEEADVSRSVINDVMRVARRAEIIDISPEDGQTLANSTVRLIITGEKRLQQAVMRCDYTYLSELGSMTEMPFDFEQASCALYDSNEHTVYLRRLLNHYQ